MNIRLEQIVIKGADLCEEKTQENE